MRIKVTLSNSAGELDCEMRWMPVGKYDEQAEINAAVAALVDRCLFSIGDTIKIEEVP